MDDEDEEEREGGLSKSGKELKMLLRRSNGLNGDTVDDTSPVVTPKKETPKEEAVDDKATTCAAGRGTLSTSKSSKGKRKEGSKTPNSTPLKKVKTEHVGIQVLKSVKDENASSSKSMPARPTAPVTEAEIRGFMLQRTQVTARDLSDQFKSRLMLQEERDAFSAIMKRISKIQKKTEGGPSILILRERERDNLM